MQRGLGPTGIQRALHDALGRVTCRQAKGVRDLQIELRIVTLIGVGAVVVANVGRNVSPGAGKQVVTRLILAVQQAEYLLFDIAQLVGDRLAISVADNASPRL
ncbi:hypothetical protein D3C80_1910990 [compost metagenome]